MLKLNNTYHLIIIYLVLFILVMKMFKKDTKETFDNPDYDPIAIANISRLAGDNRMIVSGTIILWTGTDMPTG